MLKILVAGSSRKTSDDGNIIVDEKFIKICEEIGRQLADRKHQVYLLSDDETHADTYIFRGYAKEVTNNNIKAPPLKITYGFDDDPENEDYEKFEELRAHYKNLRTEDLFTDDKYPFNRVAIVQELDALIVIGGFENTAHLVEIGSALKKTIIPVTAFGGTASSVWERTKSMLNFALQQRIDPMTKSAEDVSSNRVKELIDILEKMVGIQKKETGISYKVLVFIEILILASWFIILVTGKNYPLIALPLIIFVMAFCGIILRSLIRLHKDADQIIPTKVFIIELGIGIALGVIYYIFFLVGASSISANFEDSIKGRTFTSLALVVSLLSIAVSFLLKESIEGMHKRLSSITEIKSDH